MKAWLYRRHPIAKIFFLFCVSLSFFFSRSPEYITVITVASIVFLVASGFPLGRAFAFLRVIGVLFVFLMVMYAFLSRVEGELVYVTWPWGTFVSENTFPQGGAIVLRVLGLLALSGAVLNTMGIAETAAAFHRAGMPRLVVLVVELTVGFFNCLQMEWDGVVEGYHARGFDRSGGGFISWVRRAMLLTPTFMFAILVRVKTMSIAVESRGAGSEARWAPIKDVTWRAADWLVVVLALAVSAVCALIVFHHP